MRFIAQFLKRQSSQPQEEGRKNNLELDVDPEEMSQPPLGYHNKNDNHFSTTSQSIAETSERVEDIWIESELESVLTELCQLSQAEFTGIVICEKTHIIGANQNITQIFGYGLDEIAGKSFLDLLLTESRSVVLRNIVIKYEYPFQVIALKKSGATFPVEILNTIFTYEGRQTRAMAIREITERTPAEVLYELQQTQKDLEAAARDSTQELRFANERLRVELNERRRIEARLKLADQIISTVDSLILVSNKSGEITYANPSVYKILGYTPEEVVGQRWLKLMQTENDESQPRTAPLVPELEENKREISSTSYEHQIFDKPGNPRWILWQDTKGPDDSLIRIGYDITQRKQAEAEIIRRNQELTIIQSAGFAITSSLDLRFVLDTITHEMTKLLGVESCAIFEWSEAENLITLMGKYDASGWWDPNLLAKAYVLAKYPVKQSVVEEQIPEQMTVHQPHIDPAEFNYMQEAALKSQLLLPMIFQKQVIGLVELGDSRSERDFSYQEISLAKLLIGQAASAIQNAKLFKQAQQEILERKRAESDLEAERTLLAQRVKERTAELSRANLELARAAQLKDEFLASMSHELRTPLNTILGSSEILQSGVFGELNEKQLKYLRNLEESGKHLLALINDILDLSKIEAGKLDVEIRPISIKSVCEASLRLVKELAHKKQLQVSLDLDEQLMSIPADERRLKQILVNLLSNAVKFTPEGGQIGLEVVEDRSRCVVNFTVWDTGIGVAKEDINRLFQPFVQVDSKLSRQYSGTGLGLSLVSRMVEMHGGGVSMESEVGKGSRFIVTLPAAKTVNVSEPDLGGNISDSEPGLISNHLQKHIDGEPLILLAEDNENSITMMIDYLNAQGYRVVVARSGEEAITRAGEELPNLILMDIQMPGMDGLEATHRLKADAKLARVPIIAMTALAMPGDRERCLKAGVNEYLSKPINLRELDAKIDTYLTMI